MVFDICFYKYYSNRLSQYPTLDYAQDVIIENLKLTFPLNGKRQLSIIKRGDGDCIRLYQIYNHVYNKGADSFGVCLVFYKNFPSDIKFLFDFYGSIISDIINEGKAFHYNDDGEISSDDECLDIHDSSLKKYKTRIKNTLKGQKTGVATIPQNVYSSYKYEHVICQLSDKSWSLDEVFVNNNIVIITEKVEDENILQVSNIIKGLNDKNKTNERQIAIKDKQIESLKDQNTKKDKQIKELKEKLRISENANQKQSGSHGAESFDKQKVIGTKEKALDRTKPNPPVKPPKKKKDIDWWDFCAFVVIGIIALLILFNLIAPWFISGLFPKLAVVLACIAILLLILAFSKGKKVVFLVCLSVIILASMMTGYGLIWGFPTIQSNNSAEEVLIIENGAPHVETAGCSKKTGIPDNFILVPSGSLNQYMGAERQIDSFYISQYEMTQVDWLKVFPEDSLFYYEINNEYPPNKRKIINDSLPVEREFCQIIQYCIKRSKDEGYAGFYRIEDGNCVFDTNGNGYRLPCESEWVYAARSCSKKKRYVAGNSLQDIAWYGGNSKWRPHPVGKKEPNELGIYDMCGNVSELCWPEKKFKISVYPGVNIGGDYLSYIQLSEDDVYFTEHNREIGFRLVLIPRGMKNHNIINLNTSYKTEDASKKDEKKLTIKDRFIQAKNNKDWSSMRKLADEGYSPTYMPLAKHYISNPKNHGLAKKYALKAKRAGIPGADELLKKLEDLDY